MNNIQTGIVKAVSTILFQKNEGYEQDPMSYWVRDRRVNILPNSDDTFEYNLSTKKIDENYYLEIWRVCYDEYDDIISMTTLGFIPFDLARACWDIADYCNKIEALIDL